MENIFPNINTILRILMVMPATSATIVEDRYNRSVLLYIHRGISLDYDQIISPPKQEEQGGRLPPQSFLSKCYFFEEPFTCALLERSNQKCS